MRNKDGDIVLTEYDGRGELVVGYADMTSEGAVDYVADRLAV